MKKELLNFWKNKKLTPEEQNDLLVEAFRNVFSTAEGKIVLNALMTDLFLYEETRTKREHYLNEYAKFFIRRRLGVSGTKSLTDFIAETAADGEGA